MFHTIKLGTLEYLTADALQGCTHCFSTRYGGVSTGFLSSLNLGVHRDTDPENVRKNYEILGNAVGFLPENTVFTKQRHTDIVLRVGAKDRGTGLLRETETVCDALITNEPDVALVVFTADCTPVLLHDPVRGAVAAVHSGWRGTAMGIAEKTVKAMQEAFGTNPADLRAAIGPCIGQCHFQTDRDVPQAMLDVLGAAAEEWIEQRGEKYYVNLKEINRLWLNRCGVQTVDISEDCTACQPERFWSHRTVGDRRGSLAAVIML